MKNNSYLLIAIVLFLAGQTACVKKADVLPGAVTDSRPLLTIIKNNFNFSMFYTALQRVGLDKTLENDGPYTVLVPDNNAFAASGISADSLAKIDTATLRRMISYHIIRASIPYSAIPQTIDYIFNTLAGQPVYFSVPVKADYQSQPVGSGIVHINGVAVNSTDIAASNGYIIAISRLLYYPAASIKAYLEDSPQYSYFVQALKQFGLFDQLDKAGPFVVMAPNNDMFIQNGIDEQTLATLDTLTYKKMLFNAYILYGQHFFITDLIDAPPGRGAAPGIITSDFVQVMTPGSYGATASYGLWSLNFRFIQDINWIPPYGYQYVYAPPANFTDPDHQTGNGIVHGIDGLVILPDSTKIHP